MGRLGFTTQRAWLSQPTGACAQTMINDRNRHKPSNASLTERLPCDVDVWQHSPVHLGRWQQPNPADGHLHPRCHHIRWRRLCTYARARTLAQRPGGFDAHTLTAAPLCCDAACSGGSTSLVDGVGGNARFSTQYSVRLFGSMLYVGDQCNNAIRQVRF